MPFLLEDILDATRRQIFPKATRRHLQNVFCFAWHLTLHWPKKNYMKGKHVFSEQTLDIFPKESNPPWQG